MIVYLMIITIRKIRKLIYIPIQPPGFSRFNIVRRCRTVPQMIADASPIDRLPETNPTARPNIGVSACLLGKPVRYDGDHKRNEYISDILGQQVSLIPVCPEVEMGLPVPREPIRLEMDVATRTIRLIAPGSGTDRTEQMNEFCKNRLATLRSMNLCGYIFQERSPSCGTERVKVFFPDKDELEFIGIGMFAAALKTAFPRMPTIESHMLETPEHRNHFLHQVYAYYRLIGR